MEPIIYGKCPLCGQSNTIGHACSKDMYSSNYCRQIPDEELTREELLSLLEKHRELAREHVLTIYSLQEKIRVMETTYRMYLKDTGKVD
jgi:hypothetical protein